MATQLSTRVFSTNFDVCISRMKLLQTIVNDWIHDRNSTSILLRHYLKLCSKQSPLGTALKDGKELGFVKNTNYMVVPNANRLF